MGKNLYQKMLPFNRVLLIFFYIFNTLIVLNLKWPVCLLYRKGIESLSQTMIFLSYIFATQCRRPKIFQTMNSVRWKNLSLKYQRFTPFVGKNIDIRKSEFVSKIQFLSIFNFSTTIFAFFPTRHLSLDVNFLKKGTIDPKIFFTSRF